MKKFLALMLALVMVLALCACGSKTEAPAAEEPAAEEPAEEAAPAEETEEAAGEVTWADYQAYLVEKAGANAPDLDEFKAQVDAMTGWDDIDTTTPPWDQMFTTIGLSTWDEFQQGIVKDAAVMGGPDPSASGEMSGEASEEPAGDASGEPSAEPSGEPSGGNASADYEIELDGETKTVHYEDVDNGDQATKSFVITMDGEEITGTIDKGVWTADDAANQPVVDAVKAAFEAPTAEPAA